MIRRLRISSLTLLSSNTVNSNQFFIKRQYASALFIPGSKAFETFSYLTPYLDYDEKFAEIEKLKKNLTLRGMNESADEVKSIWNFYRTIDRNRRAVEERRESIAYKIKKMNKIQSRSPDEEKIFNGLVAQGKILKQDLRMVKEILWELEETVIPRILKLPNDIHENTPEDCDIILKSSGKKPTQQFNKGKPQDHIEIGKSLGLLEYLNQFHFYLCDEAAHFEVGILSWVSDLLIKEGILRVSGVDFARSLVVEAAGMDHENPFAAFILQNNENIEKDCCNRLHLLGGASLTSFLCMHTKQLINPKHFPLRYFATGRSYVPSTERPLDLGLFGVCQTSAVHCMSMVRDINSVEYQQEFQKLVASISKMYDELGRHYRMVLRSAAHLEPAECLRVSFELWSTHYEDYIEIGHISMYGDFFSKRLLIAYQTPTGRGYPAIISGTVLNVNKLLGCLLEENADRFDIPECITKFVPAEEL